MRSWSDAARINVAHMVERHDDDDQAAQRVDGSQSIAALIGRVRDAGHENSTGTGQRPPLENSESGVESRGPARGFQRKKFSSALSGLEPGSRP